MKNQTRYELWRAKLVYLIRNHGDLQKIAQAAGLKPASVERIVQGLPAEGQSGPAELDPSAARKIEKSLDLPDGWFDEPVFLPDGR